MYQLHCERVIEPADTVPITDVSKAVYIIDLVDQPFLKYGKSSNMSRRLSEHRSEFGTCNVIAINDCSDMDAFENNLKKELISNNIPLKHKINDVVYHELIPKEFQNVTLHIFQNLIETEKPTNVLSSDQVLELEKYKLDQQFKKMELDQQTEFKKMDYEYRMEKLKYRTPLKRKTTTQTNTISDYFSS
jgi:hypothetical protein